MEEKKKLYVETYDNSFSHLWYGNPKGSSIFVGEFLEIGKDESFKIGFIPKNKKIGYQLVVDNKDTFKVLFINYIENGGTIESFYNNYVTMEREYKLRKIFGEIF